MPYVNTTRENFQTQMNTTTNACWGCWGWWGKAPRERQNGKTVKGREREKERVRKKRQKYQGRMERQWRGNKKGNIKQESERTGRQEEREKGREERERETKNTGAKESETWSFFLYSFSSCIANMRTFYIIFQQFSISFSHKNMSERIQKVLYFLVGTFFLSLIMNCE